MNYTTFKTVIDSIALSIDPPLVPGVMCDADGQRDRFVNRAYTLNLRSDSVNTRFDEHDTLIEEQWVLEVVFCGSPERWFERLVEARECAEQLRNRIDAIPQETLLQIADSANPFETVVIKTGAVSHDSRLARDGILVVNLDITVTIFT